MQASIEHTEPYKETELGLLPESWDVVRFEDIGKFQYGYTETSSTKKIGPKFLRITDIDLNSSRIFWETVPYCKITQKEFPKYALEKGDILIARIGATTGKTCIIRDTPESVFASYLIRFNCNKQKVDSEYCYLFTISRSYWEQINANKEGKLKKGVSSSQLKNFKIPLPPFPEQQKIAFVLFTIQTAQEKTDAIITALKELKKAMMKHLFTYGPVSSEESKNVKLKETEIGLVPEEWDVVNLGTIGEFQYGYTETSNLNQIGPKFLRITDIDMNTSNIFWETVPYCKIDQKELPKYLLQTGDVLIARIGATTGKTCLIKNPPEGVFASYLIRFISDETKVDPFFIYYFTVGDLYWNQINTSKEGKLKKGVSSSQLKNFKVPLPSLSIQQQIASMLIAIDKKAPSGKFKDT